MTASPKLVARISTKLVWSDLVLDRATMDAISQLGAAAAGDRESRGVRAFFHGPAGTGKTLTATLLGKQLGREVDRVDLSLLVPQSSGQTERQLAAIFDAAAARHAHLLFAEADALFGRRTPVTRSQHGEANREVDFFLQRLEAHAGPAIVATSVKANIDEAFVRRFHFVVSFPVPDAAQRLQLWKQSLGSATKLARDIDLPKLAEEQVLTGGQIVNVVRAACLRATQRTDKMIWLEDLIASLPSPSPGRRKPNR